MELWKYIPSLKNPANVPSRGVTTLEFNNCKKVVVLFKMVLRYHGSIDVPFECLEKLSASEKRTVHGLFA